MTKCCGPRLWAIGSRADLEMYVSFIDEHTQLQKASRYLGAALLIYASAIENTQRINMPHF